MAKSAKEGTPLNIFMVFGRQGPNQI